MKTQTQKAVLEQRWRSHDIEKGRANAQNVLPQANVASADSDTLDAQREKQRKIVRAKAQDISLRALGVIECAAQELKQTKELAIFGSGLL